MVRAVPGYALHHPNHPIEIRITRVPDSTPIPVPGPAPIDTWRHAVPRFIAIIAVMLGAIWYIAAWSDQQMFKILGAAGIVIFLINPFEMTKPLNAFERTMIAIGIGFALYVSVTLGWLIVQDWMKSAPKPIYA